MRQVCLLAIFLTLVGCHPREQRLTKPISSLTTTSTVTVGREGEAQFPVVDNGRFYVISEYRLDDDKMLGVRLEEHTVTQVRTDRECCSAEITVKGSIDDQPRWTLKKKASYGEMFDRFYRTVTPGCCGTATRYSYFDPLTGHQSFVATEPIAALAVVGSYELSRYLALNRISEPGDDNFVLQIQYGSQSGPTQILFLSFPGEDIGNSSITLEYLQKGKREKSILANQDGTFPREFALFPRDYPSNLRGTTNDITGFSFLLKIGTQPVINIPVVKDHLEFSSAVLPKNFHLSETIPPKYATYLKAISE